MAWTTPRTWVAGEKPPAATMNLHIRDNLNSLSLSAANFAALPAGGFAGQRAWLVDIECDAVYDGTVWRVPIQSDAGVATGTLVTNTVKTVSVVFPVAYPAGVVPVVTVSASGAFPHTRLASPGTTTNTGFDASVINTVSTTQFTFNWISRG